MLTEYNHDGIRVGLRLFDKPDAIKKMLKEKTGLIGETCKTWECTEIKNKKGD
jgi:hypothetical protein